MESSLWFAVSVEILVWLAHVLFCLGVALAANLLEPEESKKSLTWNLRYASYWGTGLYIAMEVLGHFDLV